MDERPRGYREPAPPPPERFPVRLGTAARVSLLMSLGAIALSIVVVLLTGRVFFLFIAAIGPALFYVLSGAPRTIEVHHDAVVIRSWLRAPMRLPASALSVHLRDGELLFVRGGATLSIAADHFPGDSLDRCGRALEESGVEVHDERG
jgi:hypothetical protein